VVLVAALLAAPLAFGAVQAWAWVAMYTAVAAALLCWAFASLHERAARVIWTPLYIPFVLFVAIAGLQWLTGHASDPMATREGLIKSAGNFLIFFLAVNLFGGASKRIWRRIGWCVAMFSLALAVFGIIQFFSDPERVYWTVKPRYGGYIFGPYISHNHYAGLMEMLVAITLAFFLSMRREQSERALIAFAVLVAMISVVLSGSRGGTIALVIEGALFALVMVKNHWRRRAIATLALAVVLASLWLLPAGVAERFSAGDRTRDVSYTFRKGMTLDSLRIFRDYPLSGIGVGGFEAVYPRYQSFATNLVLDYAHNDYAQLLAETGVFGGTLALLSLALFLAGFWMAVGSPLLSQRAWLQIGAFIGCMGLLVHSWVDFNLHIPANAAWFAFLVGLTQAGSAAMQLHEPRRSSTDMLVSTHSV
jgi:O-antigen ligase